MSETLPIFPLNTVLFPGAPLPLRIFEPRYRKMLERCLRADRRFGVVLIKNGPEVGGTAEPYDVGTVARIENVRDEDGGAIPVFTRGEERFRIISLDRSGDYLVGDIELLSDKVDAAAGPAADLARKAADEYIRLLLTIQGEWHRILELPTDPLKLSYFLGTVLLGLDGAVRQKILETDPVSSRLTLAARAISEAATELQKTVMRAGPGRERTVFGAN
ncbi:MAG: LON peptidase substrate-binding domain-containing protein [Chloroflexi bacterium]|nr:LON peptidase substrate-binding domain-containing protein [Chloroflexota bacterium]